MLQWFDAHLDLAMLAELGRDLTLEPAECAGPDQLAAVTFPSLRAGNVTHVLATIFTEADGPREQSITYLAGDAEAANQAGLRQLKRYQEWHRPHFYERMAQGAGADGTGGEGAASGARPAREREGFDADATRAPEFLILIEGADPILEPADLGEWREQGVVAVGMAWWKPSRYAGGNGTDLGLTDLGRALVKECDRLGVVHDASHLSDRAFWELCEETDQVIVASHSNCRALLERHALPTNAIPPQLKGHPEAARLVMQRHLDDRQIREIVKRGGVIGLNLFSSFLGSISYDDKTARATIADCVDHVEHICAIAGDRRHVGLGSDMDGGFSAARLPEGIDRPRDLVRLAEALSARGWPDVDVQRFAFGNWGEFWGVKGS